MLLGLTSVKPFWYTPETRDASKPMIPPPLSPSDPQKPFEVM